MLNIGDFAKHGRVSVRMLRHYDAIGLLRPARVDPFSGYRCYEAAQLTRLNRVIALKDLGFTLQQVRAVLDEEVDTAELRGMLRLGGPSSPRPSRRPPNGWPGSRRGSGRSRVRGPCPHPRSW